MRSGLMWGLVVCLGASGALGGCSADGKPNGGSGGSGGGGGTNVGGDPTGKSGLTISGEFPFRDDTGNTMTSTDNSVTIRLTTVDSSNSASRTIEGAAKSRFGVRCTIANGTASFTR